MSDGHVKRDFLYIIAEKIFEKFLEKDRGERKISMQVKENLEKLYPFAGKERVKKYYIQKIRISLLMGLAGILLATGLLLSELLQPAVAENKIERQGYGGMTKNVPVKVTVGGEKEYEMDLRVRERLYSEKQLKELYKDALQELEKRISGDNETLEHVETDLALVTEIPGYPFHIEWESQNYDLIDGEGKLREREALKQGEQVGLNAVFTCEEFRAEHLFYIRIYPRELTVEERMKERLLEAVETSERETGEEAVMILPEKLDGKTLIWRSKRSDVWFGVLLGAVCTAVTIYFMKDRDLKKEVEKRELQMRLAYPEIVSKLSIYLGAGITVRMAWEKICADYEKREAYKQKNYAYEEMKIACQEMKSGIAETAAYERFGRRCGIPLYGKFSTLLTQNLRKGSTRLGPLLKEESRLAFEERKNTAKKAGEEAGTKLLLPMEMMLCVVMLMILLPAFITF